jgi:hypothetical protein
VFSTAGIGILFAGVGAGTANTGANNAFFGGSAGHNNTTAGGNVFFGTNTGFSNTTDASNAIIVHAADVEATNLSIATALASRAMVGASD